MPFFAMIKDVMLSTPLCGTSKTVCWLCDVVFPTLPLINFLIIGIYIKPNIRPLIFMNRYASVFCPIVLLLFFSIPKKQTIFSSFESIETFYCYFRISSFVFFYFLKPNYLISILFFQVTRLISYNYVELFMSIE